MRKDYICGCDIGYNLKDNIVVAYFKTGSFEYAVSRMLRKTSPEVYIDTKKIGSVCEGFTKHYGMARCAPEDAFNIKTGKRLAYDRLRKRVLRAAKVAMEYKLKESEELVKYCITEKQKYKMMIEKYERK